MHDLSLHLLDLIDNSIRATASVIFLTIACDSDVDVVKISLEDNGCGLKVTPKQALDPFYTTKSGKKTGLGLSLFKATVEQADGKLTLSKSRLGGLAVRAKMSYKHIERKPLGDLAATISSVIAANKGLDLKLRLQFGKCTKSFSVSQCAKTLPAGKNGNLAVARKASEWIKKECTFPL